MNDRSDLRTCFPRMSAIVLIVFLLVPKGSNSFFGQEAFYSGDLQFERYTIKDGYPDDNAFSIIQDSLGYLWIASNRGLIRHNGLDFKTYKPVPNEIQGAVLTSICQAPGGNLWVGSMFHGLLYYDFQRDQLIHVVSGPGLEQLKQEFILKIIQDKFGYLWVGTKRGLYRLRFEMTGGEPKLLEIGKYILDQNREAIDLHTSTGEVISGLIEDQNQDLWVGSNQGLFKVETLSDGDTNKFIQYKLSSDDRDSILTLSILTDSLLGVGTSSKGVSQLVIFNLISKSYFSTPFKIENDAIESILLSKNSELWIKSYNNHLYHIKEGLKVQDWSEITQYEIASDKPWNIKEPFISMIEDRYGMIWIGSESYGLIKMNAISNRFKYHRYATKPGEKEPMFRCILELNDSIVLLGSHFNGLFTFNRKRNRFSKWNLPFLEENSRINTMMLDGNDLLWIGLHQSTRSALIQMDPLSHNYRFLQIDSGDTSDFSFETVLSISQDQANSFWIGTADRGLFNYIPERDTFINYLVTIDNYVASIVHSILVDRYQNIWIGVGAAGLHKLTGEGSFKHFLGYQSPWHIIQDKKGIIWSSSPFGFFKLDPQSEISRSYSVEDGMGAEGVYWSCEYKGYLWLVTFNGISCFNPLTEEFRTWNWEDGLEYFIMTRAACQLSDGSIAYTVGDGIQIFHPDSLIPLLPPEIQIESITVGDTLLRSYSTAPSSYTFPHDFNNPEFTFIGLEYTQPEKITYSYKLKGIDSDWIPNGDDKVVRYVELEPGHYNFLVRAANRDGIWSEPKSVEFTIVPPWWATLTAKITYMTCIIFLLLGIRSYELKRKFTALEAERLLELDTFKSRLYTNITHEFRTPLTIILGMADQLQDKVVETGKDGLQMIQRNGQRLMQLVNQILDLQKLEAGAMTIQMNRGDIVVFLKYLVESFQSYAISRDIDIQFIADSESVIMDFDQDKIQDIVSNLLSNALKFTPKGGTIQVGCSIENSHQFKMIVSDDGVGISPENISYIFDRFYQADDSSIRNAEGTGVGLALTKELVGFLGGQISVDSQVGRGSTFTVILPMRQTALESVISTPRHKALQMSTSMHRQPDETQELSPTGLPQILIIEDHHDVGQYIRSILQNHYQIMISVDGQNGIDIAREFIPDLVVSDVMMPVMDGFQVCNTLKHDPNTSHIPIILLTAKANIESRLEGLQYGADAYLTKPFIKEELLVRVEALLTQRSRLHAHYQRMYGIGEKSQIDETVGPKPGPEKQFVRQIKLIVQDHLDDPTFGVDQLCRAMTMSNSQLYRKLKAQTGLSAHYLIQAIRLSHARTLLRETTGSVSEIAYQCGFNDPEYFSRVFRKEFGSTPSEFRSS